LHPFDAQFLNSQQLDACKARYVLEYVSVAACFLDTILLHLRIYNWVNFSMILD
jgi:hypothetical protein